MRTDRLKITEEDVLKYSEPGPRYTSYPTANLWSDAFNAVDFKGTLQSGGLSSHLSVYLHVPFCEKLCHFCACNRIIDRSHSKDERFVELLVQEVKIVRQLLGRSPSVDQMHWGGGTPTYLAPELILSLTDTLRHHFQMTEGSEVSIEVNPTVTTFAHLNAIKESGFNRISMGVQDFDPAVQAIINRGQSFEQTHRLIDRSRNLGLDRINLDLIYGLPRQSLLTVEKTIRLVADLRPARIALYSFANVPWKQPFHRKFLDSDLPTGLEKVQLYLLARTMLESEGYQAIGMDHFALPGDELALAAQEGKLHRNFMGYTTLPDLDLIGFGPSAISHFGNTYAQNTKSYSDYEKKIMAGELSTQLGHRLSQDDQLRQYVIASLMCNFYIDILKVEEVFGIQFSRYFAGELVELEPYEKNFLVQSSPHLIQVVGRGQILVRSIAMVFDRYLKIATDHRRFSNTI